MLRGRSLEEPFAGIVAVSDSRLCLHCVICLDCVVVILSAAVHHENCPTRSRTLAIFVSTSSFVYTRYRRFVDLYVLDAGLTVPGVHLRVEILSYRGTLDHERCWVGTRVSASRCRGLDDKHEVELRSCLDRQAAVCVDLRVISCRKVVSSTFVRFVPRSGPALVACRRL